MPGPILYKKGHMPSKLIPNLNISDYLDHLDHYFDINVDITNSVSYDHISATCCINIITIQFSNNFANNLQCFALFTNLNERGCVRKSTEEQKY